MLKDIVAATGFRGCSAVVRKCTQTDMEKRYDSAEEVLSAIKSRRKMMVVLPVLVVLLIIGMGTFVLYSHWNNSVAEDVSAPIADTVVVSHIDTVFLSREEDIEGNVPVQKVVVRSQEYTESEQKLLDEVRNRIETLYLSYKQEVENYNGYREFLSLKLACFSNEAINIGHEIEKRSIQDEDLFASQFTNYYGRLNYKFYSKLVELSQNIPSFQEQYNDGIITNEQYQKIGEELIKYADSLYQTGAY